MLCHGRRCFLWGSGTDRTAQVFCSCGGEFFGEGPCVWRDGKFGCKRKGSVKRAVYRSLYLQLLVYICECIDLRSAESLFYIAQIMKLVIAESEIVTSHSTPGPKPASIIFHNEDSDGPKPKNQMTNGNQNGQSRFLEDNEKGTDNLTCNKSAGIGRIASGHDSSKTEQFEELLELEELYTDKIVVQYQLSNELGFRYEENAYSVIMDICIDEGVAVASSYGKILLENNIDEDDEILTLINESVMTEPKDSEMLSNKDFSELCVEELGSESLPSFESLNKNSNEVELEQPLVQVSNEKSKSETSGVITAATESSNSACVETISVNSSPVSSPEIPERSDANVSKFETESTMTCDCKSLPPTDKDNCNFNSLTPTSSTDHHDIGESSFITVGPSASRINYSGPTAYSGSLSLRSDSSTTSTRSFAFPILQSEWHSSPVRMVKAERKNFWKLKRWRQGLSCCRF